MSNLSSFLAAAGKPKLITLLTSGTGYHVPTEDMARCLVRVQAGGASGYGSQGAGGGGAMVELFLRIPIAGMSYIVGAGGASQGVSGSHSYFGPFGAMGGMTAGVGGMGNRNARDGGQLFDVATFNTVGLLLPVLNGVAGGAGGTYGGGGAGGYGSCAGYPKANGTDKLLNGAYGGASPYGGGGGGSSFYGIGGAGSTGIGGVGANATNYGAGGGSGQGAGGSGMGGCIEIWDFGA